MGTNRIITTNRIIITFTITNRMITSKVTNMNSLVSGYSNTMFQSFNTDLSCWDVSSVTDMTWMFYEASSFNTDLSSWNVSSVTDMRGMFYSITNTASAFNNNVSSWDVSSVTDMTNMFNGASS